MNLFGTYSGFTLKELPMLKHLSKCMVLLVILGLCTPSSALAYNSEGSGDIVIIAIALFMSLAVFLICREIVCWYFKINLINDKFDKVIDLLEEISTMRNGTDQSFQ